MATKKAKEQSADEIKRKAIEEYQRSQTNAIMEFAKQQQTIMLENMSSKNKTNFYKKYKPDQVDRYLADPSKSEKELREVSRYLSVSSPQYWRLINYLPSIAILSPIIVPFDSEKVIKNKIKTTKILNKCTKVLDNMNVQHEFLKILQTIFREDIYYGYEIETDTSYYIKTLDSKYCRPYGNYDGTLNYQFDFSYFDNNSDPDVDKLTLYEQIDKEFVVKYKLYKENGSKCRWQEVNPDKQICIKAQESFDFCCPPFISVFNDAYDIADYKDLNKAKVEVDNTKFIGFDMETKKDSSSPDDFKLSEELMKAYFAFIQSCLGGKVGSFMSPMPFKSVDFKDSSNQIDNVSNAIIAFWSASGVADVLMGENKNAGTLKYAIKTDEALLFNVYKQIERFLSRKFKQLSGGMFKVLLPELTIFNISDELDKYLKLSQYGYVGARTFVSSAMKVTQNQFSGLAFMENEIYSMRENMYPVSSSYTMSGDEGGKTEKKDEDLTESGQQTRDDTTNENTE